jgi:hypothetical protein
MKVMNVHLWTKEEDKLAFFSYKFLNEQEQKDMANKLSIQNGISIDSFKMRMSNFMFLHTNGKKGLKNYSKQSKEIFDKYKTATKEKFGFK